MGRCPSTPQGYERVAVFHPVKCEVKVKESAIRYDCSHVGSFKLADVVVGAVIM